MVPEGAASAAVRPARRGAVVLIRLNQQGISRTVPGMLDEPADQPRSLLEFQRDFPDDAACVRYLAGRRWPTGFVCPACGATRAHELPTRRLWQCSACRQQTSLTAGTVLHGTRLPLITWFWAMYLAATLNTGISARQLRKQLGLRRYETAWMLLQKIRLAMINPQRERLSGDVEVDRAWVGGTQDGFNRGRSSTDPKALLVALAVEHHGHILGRLRMEVVRDPSGATLTEFVLRNVAPASTVHGDTWAGYQRLLAAGYRHQPRSLRGRPPAGTESSIVPGAHRVVSNLKTWLRGTHRGVGADHLERYLEEFVFRFNRRFYPMAAFDTLLGLTSKIEPTAYTELRGPRPDDGSPRRRGRATGLTQLPRRAARGHAADRGRPGPACSC
jgi:transposase-like protein/predicted RNA-binding Zn-ribbon protein involved in translation (DUF1610 family)